MKFTSSCRLSYVFYKDDKSTLCYSLTIAYQRHMQQNFFTRVRREELWVFCFITKTRRICDVSVAFLCNIFVHMEFEGRKVRRTEV